MLQKYEELVAIYTKAGIDLGIKADAFKRSRKSLDKDIKILGRNRTKGAKRLLKNFLAELVQKINKQLPEKYKQLAQAYKEEARPIMGEALSHSTSATFYLARSGYTSKLLVELLTFADQSKTMSEKIKEKLTQFIKARDVATFVLTKNKQLASMLVASVHTVKTLSQDIRGVPKISRAQTNRELDQLRAKNGASLNDFEKEIDQEQRGQLPGTGRG